MGTSSRTTRTTRTTVTLAAIIAAAVLGAGQGEAAAQPGRTPPTGASTTATPTGATPAAVPEPYPLDGRFYPPPNTQPSSLGDGGTFEIGLGGGWQRFQSNESGFDAEDRPTSGGNFSPNLHLGFGSWIGDRTALTLRITGVAEGSSLACGFVGGALQFWVSDHLWFGFGAGFGYANGAFDTEGGSLNADLALGLDLRLGYTPLIFASGGSINFSLESTPLAISEGTIHGVGVLIGYQYL